jgi:putative DNA primase/helicase
MTPLHAALRLIDGGLSVIPIKTDGSKAPCVAWKPFQDRIPTVAEVEEMFKAHCGIAIICGAVSGNLEVIDVESNETWLELSALIDEHLPGVLATLPQVIPPRGGRHIYYRCSEIAGNQKLAVSRENKVLIETRGEGGYVLTVSSPPECHPTGKPYTIAVSGLTQVPTITPEQRDIMLSCCRSFNQVKPVEDKSPSNPSSTGGRRPGDDYNIRGEVLPILLKHGWKVIGRQNGSATLQRPGKTGKGISATFGKVGPNVLYNFSSNAGPLDNDRAYDAFGVFCRLEAGGDFDLATRMLAAEGYGEKPTIPGAKPKAKPNGHAIEQPLPPLPAADDEHLDLVFKTSSPTQDNVALIFEDQYKTELRYCEQWGYWLRWMDCKWEPDRTSLAFDYSRSVARKVNVAHRKMDPARASFCRGVEMFSRASRIFATRTKEWDRDTWLINNPKETVDLQTSQSHPHVRTDYITKCTRVSPADGPHPVFDRFLLDVCLQDHSLAEYHQRSLGACLSGAIKDNFLLFWYGTGQNGKNTFGDLMTWILGDYAKVIPTETLMSAKNPQHPTSLANLRGLRLAVSSEVSEGSYWDEARVKSLTGDTEIAARFMRQDFFEFPRTHKHLVYGNHRPMLRIVDPGMQARLHIVPFKAYFPPDARDPDMRKKLEVEAPQILSWLIAGHERWLEDGYLKKCSAVQAETDEYFLSQSTNEAWLSECCIEDEERASTAKELYTSYKNWKEGRGEGVMSQTRWGEWIGQRGYTKYMANGRVVYRGIGVKPESVLFNGS